MPWLELTPPLPLPVAPRANKLKTLPTEIYTTTLNYLLSNDLILRQTLPYLPPSSVLKLAATSRDFRSLIYHTPGALRHLDLTGVKAAHLGSDALDGFRDAGQPDRLLTEDEYYSAPLRNIFSKLGRASLLPSVQTLILDGLSVTAELVHDLITDPSLNIRILSLRGVKNLNEGKLQQSLQTVCRPGRPVGTPRVQGIYLFSAPSTQVQSSTPGSSRASSPDSEWEVQPPWPGSQDNWYQSRGRALARSVSPEWARTIQACRGVISFDAILCAGPRHLNSPALGLVDVTYTSGREVPQWAVATHALDGCSGCGAAPEGMTEWGRSERSDCPLLEPVPLHSSTVKAAGRPSQAEGARFVARCADCLWNRHCNSCLKWWCEACYSGVGGANSKAGVAKDCWECGPNCFECISATQRTCKSCCGGYCIIHNEGSTSTHVRCCSRGSSLRARDLY
ncbi:hypothetical protein M0657_008421 [Pyricularia oryzae]|uniref:F-box domain-containing protein n=1 Tax=Pyricularia oryzae TaxID=318829 RepID=A0A4P7NPC2_PYROR|nr:hypothetical protein M9X92_010383 [Pyricularia oryzae]KAI7916758.1 hypothetical protein M0657_008421 [Pyricularia oryzae]QBZ64012.1 hypothetical protein PoMZ_05703 [Pyricularia oryzae]